VKEEGEHHYGLSREQKKTNYKKGMERLWLYIQIVQERSLREKRKIRARRTRLGPRWAGSRSRLEKALNTVAAKKKTAGEYPRTILVKGARTFKLKILIMNKLGGETRCGGSLGRKKKQYLETFKGQARQKRQ